MGYMYGTAEDCGGRAFSRLASRGDHRYSAVHLPSD